MPALFDPSDSRPLHFVGIGGAGMSALALIAHRRGVAVTGCDADGSGLADLQQAGIAAVQGVDPAHITGARAVIVTAAAASDHPEILAAKAAGIPVIPRKEALAALVNGHTVAAIAGTHGKTTTTVMTTEALRAAGCHPSGLAGGRVTLWGGNAHLDSDTLFVVEADEYDQAFLTLEPTVAVINNVEADHLECYGSVDALEAAFVTFAGRAQQILIGTADSGSDRVAAQLDGRVTRFGFESSAGIRLDAIVATAISSRAEVCFPDGSRQVLTLQVPGRHNLRNAAAALGVAYVLKADVRAATEALEHFTGVGRRFDRLGDAAGITIVDDYAHHPTELAATLEAARQAFPERRLVALFQPHLYSRTQEHGTAMGEILARADLVVVTDVYGAREKPVLGVTGRLVADAAISAGALVVYEPDPSLLVEEVASLLREGDVLLTMGAGDVTRVGPAVARRLETQ